MFNMKPQIQPYIAVIVLSIFFLAMSSFRGCRRKMTEEEIKVWQSKRPIIENKVREWIINYAKYPKSYESLSFDNFAITSSIDSSCINCNTLTTKHKFVLLNRDSIQEIAEITFMLDEYEYIKAFANHKVNFSGSLFEDYFITHYGRSLTQADSIYFCNYPIERINRTVNSLNRLFEDQKE
jgi:hypothetical protein